MKAGVDAGADCCCCLSAVLTGPMCTSAGWEEEARLACWGFWRKAVAEGPQPEVPKARSCRLDVLPGAVNPEIAYQTPMRQPCGKQIILLLSMNCVDSCTQTHTAPDVKIKALSCDACTCLAICIGIAQHK